MSTKTIERPEFVTDEHLEYLDELRQTGETNMFGAARYLDAEFPELREGEPASHTMSAALRSSKKAKAVLSYWMSTFGGPR